MGSKSELNGVVLTIISGGIYKMVSQLLSYNAIIADWKRHLSASQSNSIFEQSAFPSRSSHISLPVDNLLRLERRGTVPPRPEERAGSEARCLRGLLNLLGYGWLSRRRLLPAVPDPLRFSERAGRLPHTTFFPGTRHGQHAQSHLDM